MRLNQIARKIDVSTETIVQFFEKEGIAIKHAPNTKLTADELALLVKGLPEAKKLTVSKAVEKKQVEAVDEDGEKEVKAATVSVVEQTAPRFQEAVMANVAEVGVGKPSAPAKKQWEEEKQTEAPTVLRAVRSVNLQRIEPISSVKVYQKREKPSVERKQVVKEAVTIDSDANAKKALDKKTALANYLSKNFPKRRSMASRSYARKKRKRRGAQGPQVEAKIKVTAFVSTEALALLLNVGIDVVMRVCADIGVEVSRHQRLDAPLIGLIAEALDKEIEITDFGHVDEAGGEVSEEAGVVRAPIVVVMGHVDHGKTSLLDYVRKTKLVEGESGGITQHIGAYQIDVEGRLITFLDTPGHKAFTAMRARGTKLADVAIIVIAADDGLMPQTREAIGHAQLGGIPMVFAFNKMDKKGVDVDRVKQQLAKMGVMVEDWGGKFQCENISALTGQGVDDLLEKVLLEADVLGLKADPSKPALGTVVESSLMKGRGYVTTVILKDGTLRVGDVMLAGPYFGKVKALFTAGGKNIKECPPALPVQALGLNGAPQAGEALKIVPTEQEARTLSNDYQAAFKDQTLRAQHRSAIQRMQKNLTQESVDFFNVLIKGDTDGAVEALADSLSALSNEKVSVRIIYRAVGPINESDALLAASAGAVVIGFHTKIDGPARKVVAKNGTQVVLCRVIYEAIEAVEKAMNPQKASFEEVFIGNADVVKVFQISRVGTVAGCVVQKGSIKKGTKIRILRNEAAIYTGAIQQLKREKEVIKEARKGTECGISTPGFNDIQVGDVVECFEQKPLT